MRPGCPTVSPAIACLSSHSTAFVHGQGAHLSILVDLGPMIQQEFCRVWEVANDAILHGMRVVSVCLLFPMQANQVWSEASLRPHLQGRPMEAVERVDICPLAEQPACHLVTALAGCQVPARGERQCEKPLQRHGCHKETWSLQRGPLVIVAAVWV